MIITAKWKQHRRQSQPVQPPFSWENPFSWNSSKTRSFVLLALFLIIACGSGMAAETEAIPEKYQAFVGTYASDIDPYKGKEFIIGFKDGQLTAQIPNRPVMELEQSKEDGLWYLKKAKALAFSFEPDAAGKIVAMTMYQIDLLVKKKEEDAAAKDQSAGAGKTPGKYDEYTGDYINITNTVVFKGYVQEGKLCLQYRGKENIELTPPDEKGRWYFTVDPQVYVTFGPDATGETLILRLHQFVRIPRKAEPAINK